MDNRQMEGIPRASGMPFGWGVFSLVIGTIIGMCAWLLVYLETKPVLPARAPEPAPVVAPAFPSEEKRSSHEELSLPSTPGLPVATTAPTPSELAQQE